MMDIENIKVLEKAYNVETTDDLLTEIAGRIADCIASRFTEPTKAKDVAYYLYLYSEVKDYKEGNNYGTAE